MENINSHPSPESDKGPASPQEDNSNPRTTPKNDNEPASPEEEKEVFRSRILESFSTRLKQVRKNRKLTQEEVAGFLDSSNSLICNYEKGKQEPGIVAATILASKLGVTLDWLCGLDKNGKIQEQRTIWDEIPVANACLIVLSSFNNTIEFSEDSKSVTVRFFPDEISFIHDNQFDRFFEYLTDLNSILPLFNGNKFNPLDCSDEIESIAKKLLKRYENILYPTPEIKPEIKPETKPETKTTAAETH